MYWSQPGIKYRPPPKLDNTPEESKIAFGKHFQREFDLYDGPITCLNLVEKSGREKVIGDAYLDSALALDRTDMNFVYFDFHEYCRGTAIFFLSVFSVKSTHSFYTHIFCSS